MKHEKSATAPAAAAEPSTESEPLEYSGCHPDDTGWSFTLPTGEKKYIARHDVPLIKKLQTLPVQTRIFLMNLSVTELEEYLKATRKKSVDQLTDLLLSKWYWRETGDPIDIDDALMWPFDAFVSQRMCLKKLKSKKSYSLEEIEKMIQWFTNDFGDCYRKEDRE